MYNVLKAMLVLCLLAFCLSGCYPSGDLELPSNFAPNVNDSGDNVSSAEFDGINNLKMQVALAENYPTEAPVIKTMARKFELESVKALLLGGKNITDEQTVDGRNFVTFITDDDCVLTIDNDRGNITFFAEQSSDISMMQYYASTYTGKYYYRFPHIESELEGFSRSEALARADELVKKLDFKHLGEPVVYTITAEDIHSFDEDITLTMADEFYFVRYPTAYKEIPISLFGGDVTETASHRFSSVDIILTKDKLVRLSGRTAVEEIEEIETSRFACTAEAALTRLYNYHSLISNIDYPLEYNDLKLVYITSQVDSENGVLTYIPLWRISGYEDFSEAPDELRVNSVYRFVNPETGFVYNYAG